MIWTVFHLSTSLPMKLYSGLPYIKYLIKKLNSAVWFEVDCLVLFQNIEIYCQYSHNLKIPPPQSQSIWIAIRYAGSPEKLISLLDQAQLISALQMINQPVRPSYSCHFKCGRLLLNLSTWRWPSLAPGLPEICKIGLVLTSSAFLSASHWLHGSFQSHGVCSLSV